MLRENIYLAVSLFIMTMAVALLARYHNGMQEHLSVPQVYKLRALAREAVRTGTAALDGNFGTPVANCTQLGRAIGGLNCVITMAGTHAQQQQILNADLSVILDKFSVTYDDWYKQLNSQ